MNNGSSLTHITQDGRTVQSLAFRAGHARRVRSNKPHSNLKIAIVHDYLAQAGGAERVVEAIHRIFPEAPIFTSVFDPKATLPYFEGKDIRTSFLQQTIFGSQRWHKFALPFYPIAFEHFDLSDYDVIISSSSSFAKSVITNPECCHICYCHTPARFVWRHHEYMSQSKRTKLLRPLLGGILTNLRTWDVTTANRVDYFVANSHNIAERIHKFYRREADVIYPPVETNRFSPISIEDVGDHFLIVSRLIGYKRIDLAIDACTKLGVRLRVAGVGPDAGALQRRAGPTVEFLGRLSDEQVAIEMARCRAMIFPGEEDFGITPVECMASGRPVVAYGAGGALETIVDGETGIFFADQTVESVIDALKAASHLRVDPVAVVKHARQFDISLFQDRFEEFVAAAFKDHQAKACKRSIASSTEFNFTGVAD
jgi:glycosyltransferase involved in cell wall biosynthesis